MAAVLSFAGYLANLYFEARILRRVLWPHLGLVFPILGILLSGLALFVNSHPAFRWLVRHPRRPHPLYRPPSLPSFLTQLPPPVSSVSPASSAQVFLLQPLCVTMNTLETANLDIVITCRANKTCETDDGWSDDELDRVYWSRMALIFLSVWMVLISGYLAASLGVCRPRYPVRLFSSSHPMSELPSTATQYGRLAAANVVKPADAKRWTTDGNGGRSPNRSPSPAGGATRRKDDANRSRRNEP